MALSSYRFGAITRNDRGTNLIAIGQYVAAVLCIPLRTRDQLIDAKTPPISKETEGQATKPEGCKLERRRVDTVKGLKTSTARPTDYFLSIEGEEVLRKLSLVRCIARHATAEN